MKPEIKLWSVHGGKLTQLNESSFSQTYLEKDLEDWVALNPSLLGRPDLTILGRQVYIPGVGPLDILAVDPSGRLVVVEFKRHQTTRDTIAQILDYASSLQRMDIEQIHGLKNVNSAEKSEITDQDPMMILVAAGADPAVERIVGYLTSKAQLAIEVVTFTFVTLEDGQNVLARTILNPETPSVAVEQKTRTTLSELLRIAAGRKVRTLMEILRQVTRLGWQEEPVHVNGGSLRYWITAPDGKARILFGINVGGEKYDTPDGSLDVWIWPDIAAEFSQSSVEEAWTELKQFPTFKNLQKQFFTRIQHEAEAKKLFQVLEKWDLGSAEYKSKREAEERESTSQL